MSLASTLGQGTGAPLQHAPLFALISAQGSEMLQGAQVCGAIFRMDAKGSNPGVKYVHDRPEILFTLFRG